MPDLTEDYERKQVSQPIAGLETQTSHEVGECRSAETTGAKPTDQVFTSWLNQYPSNAAVSVAPSTSTPRGHERAAQNTGPSTPQGYELPIPTASCFPPPQAVDWSKSPPVAASPAQMMIGQPGFKPQFASHDFDTYKTAFATSWNELTTSYNGLVTLHSAYKANERSVVPILQVGSSRPVGADKYNVNASQSFVGGQLKPSLTKIDSAKLSPELRGQIGHTQDKLKATELDISNKRRGISNANSSLIQAAISVEVATNHIDDVVITHEIANLQLDKDQVRRDLEDFKAKVKVSVEGAKAVTSIVNILLDPLKLGANVLGAVNQGATFGGAAAEANYTIDANNQLATFDGQIRSLQNHKAAIMLSNANLGVTSALEEVHKKLNDLTVAVNGLEVAKLARGDACREMSDLIAKAGAASGLNPRDQRAAAGSVEAMPKIETILEQLQRMDEVLVMPRYSAASGVGAAMASNLNVFTDALSVLRGNREAVVQLKALWGARHASVSALVAHTASPTGGE